MGSKVARDRAPRSKPQDDPPEFETLVRQLVAHAQHIAHTPAHQAEEGREKEEPSGDVLVDCEVDGVRCVLARTSNSGDTLPLSPREREVARMIAKGYPNK